MKKRTKIVEIKCTFPGCDKVCGAVTFSDKVSVDETKNAVELGLVIDHRCEDHPRENDPK